MPLSLFVCALLASGGTATAQQPGGGVPLVLAGAVRPLQPPKEPGSWVLQLISRGGIGGQGIGEDVAISSTGSLPLVSHDSAGAVPAKDLQVLRDYISASTPSQWIGPSVSICSDCPTVLLVLTVRTSEGGAQSFTAFWDPVTKASVSAEARRIYDFARSITITPTK
jgi:hypothetical protein